MNAAYGEKEHSVTLPQYVEDIYVSWPAECRPRIYSLFVLIECRGGPKLRDKFHCDSGYALGIAPVIFDAQPTQLTDHLMKLKRPKMCPSRGGSAGKRFLLEQTSPHS